jgi:hypothetical protein
MIIRLVAPVCRQALALAILSGLVVLLVRPHMAIVQQNEEKIRQRVAAYYNSWVGVKAPEIGLAAVDRTTGPPVRLNAFRGKRVLLFSFDSGHLHQPPDDKALRETLRALKKWCQFIFLLPGNGQPDKLPAGADHRDRSATAWFLTPWTAGTTGASSSPGAMFSWPSARGKTKCRRGHASRPPRHRSARVFNKTKVTFLVCAALVAAVLFSVWSYHRPESFSTWLAPVQRPGYRLLYSQEAGGRYGAVFDTGDEQVALVHSRGEHAGAGGVAGALTIMDANGDAVCDPDRQRSFRTCRKYFGIVPYREMDGLVYPMKRGIGGTLRIVYEPASFPQGSNVTIKMDQMSPVLDIEIPWSPPAGQTQRGEPRGALWRSIPCHRSPAG